MRNRCDGIADGKSNVVALAKFLDIFELNGATPVDSWTWALYSYVYGRKKYIPAMPVINVKML